MLTLCEKEKKMLPELHLPYWNILKSCSECKSWTRLNLFNYVKGIKRMINWHILRIEGKGYKIILHLKVRLILTILWKIRIHCELNLIFLNFRPHKYVSKMFDFSAISMQIFIYLQVIYSFNDLSCINYWWQLQTSLEIKYNFIIIGVDGEIWFCDGQYHISSFSGHHF